MRQQAPNHHQLQQRIDVLCSTLSQLFDELEQDAKIPLAYRMDIFSQSEALLRTIRRLWDFEKCAVHDYAREVVKREGKQK